MKPNKENHCLIEMSLVVKTDHIPFDIDLGSSRCSSHAGGTFWYGTPGVFTTFNEPHGISRRVKEAVQILETLCRGCGGTGPAGLQQLNGLPPERTGMGHLSADNLIFLVNT
jgi:hypothetical protein